MWKYLLIQACGAGVPEVGIFPRARVQKENQKPDLSLKFRTGAGAVAIWEVAPAQGPFLDTNSFAK